ncbi:Light-independent protochlorophyllide reductase iron-sulfur ATP-binding protein [subsurface metagenome]
MKIAISGKGGVGKSTLSAAISLLLTRSGKKVLAIDADEDANLASALGASEIQLKQIVPISEQVALIEERTGAKVKQYGQIFKLNPEVSDISGKYAIDIHGVNLLVLGAVDRGGGGCACPENVLIRSLVTDLILYKDEILVMDMEAGIEHLGRATARGVDKMIVVIEPGQRSIDTAKKIKTMAWEIGVSTILFVANKIFDRSDEELIRSAIPESELIGIIPFSEELKLTDRTGQSVLDNISEDLLKLFNDILHKIKG